MTRQTLSQKLHDAFLYVTVTSKWCKQSINYYYYYYLKCTDCSYSIAKMLMGS